MSDLCQATFSLYKLDLQQFFSPQSYGTILLHQVFHYLSIRNRQNYRLNKSCKDHFLKFIDGNSARPDLSRSNYLWWLLISTIVVVNFFYCILELCQLKFKKARHLSNSPDGFGTNKIKQLLFNCVPYGLMPYIQLNWTVVQYIQSMKPLTGNNIAINKMSLFSDAHSDVCRSGEIPVSTVLQRLALSLRGS